MTEKINIDSKRNNKIFDVLQRIERQEKLLESHIELTPDNPDYIYLSSTKNLGLWSVPRSTGEFLNYLVSFLKPKTILELGCSVGYSTIWIASAAQEINAKVYTTERFKPKIKIAKQNFSEAGLKDTITLIEGNIKDTIENWDKGSIDFIFMDADKKSYLEYLKLLLPKMTDRSLLIADNVIDMKDHLSDFYEYLSHSDGINSHILNLDNGLALISKK